MFYEKVEINDILRCPVCKHTFSEPCVLPCGQYMCAACIEKLVDAKANGIQCSMCASFHARPPGGFIVSKLMLKLMEKKPSDVYRNKAVEDLKAQLTDIAAMNASLKDIQHKAREKIKEHCDSVRRHVNDEHERVVKQCDAYRDTLLKSIQVYEKECVAHADETLKRRRDELGSGGGGGGFTSRKSSSSSSSWSKGGGGKNETDEFVERKKTYLQRFVIDDEMVHKSLEEAKAVKRRVEQQQVGFRAALFRNRLIGFEKSQAAWDGDAIIGQLKYTAIE